jgi:hypothetical protein
MHRKYYPNILFYLDSANAGFCRQMRVTFGLSPDYDIKTMSPETDEIIAVPFSVSHKQMLSHLYLMVSEGNLAIGPKMEKFIISLRTATSDEYSLNKPLTSYNDILDGLRLSLIGYKVNPR